MKPAKLLILLGCIAFLCTSCTTAANPLIKAEATPVPGLSSELYSPTAANSDSYRATLFFRYGSSAMLASESRLLTVEKKESTEAAVLRALLEGPSAERVELNRLIGDNVLLENVTVDGSTILVTVSAAFLDDGIPAQWQSDALWQTEAPLRRRLTVQSIVATLTENFACRKVQIMVETDANTNTRLDLSYFLNQGSGPSDPLTRDSSLLLTPRAAAELILQGWLEKDYQALYGYLCSYTDGETKPLYEDFRTALAKPATLTDAQLWPDSSVSEDGSYAVVTADLTLLQNGRSEVLLHCPLRLVRENGVWKIPYSMLCSLMLLN